MIRPAIDVVTLTKRFRPPIGWFRRRVVMALDRVSFRVEPGAVVGIIGPNGSGKSTLLRILSTVLRPSSGHAWIQGVPIAQVAKVKALISVAPADARGFVGQLNGRQNLAFYATLQRLAARQARERIRLLLDLVGLADLDGQPFWTYSTGQRQRLNLARALLHDPPILLLDEPTRGLDPWAAQAIRQWIRQELIQCRGKTLLIASNQPEDLDTLCDHVALLQRGRLVWDGPAHAARLQVGAPPATLVEHQ